MRLFKTLCQWAVVLCLLFIATHLKNPQLLPVRQYESSVLVILAIFATTSFLPQKPGKAKSTGLFLLTLTLLLTPYKEIAFEYRKAQVLTSQDIFKNQLGRHFIVGYGKIDEIKPLLEKGLVGGVFITKRNAEGKNRDELRAEIAYLQALGATAGLTKLVIATDQEGGEVSRLSPPLLKQPALSNLLNNQTSASMQQNQAFEYGKAQGCALADLGVNLNFSPVVDLKVNKKADPLDFHSRINQRAISTDPATTTAIAKAYVAGLASQNVTATLKHFPGLGSVDSDTHHFSATLATDNSYLDKHDWLPFKEISHSANVAIMLAHVVLTRLDPDHPVSLSKQIVQNILRKQWQFTAF